MFKKNNYLIFVVFLCCCPFQAVRGEINDIEPIAPAMKKIPDLPASSGKDKKYTKILSEGSISEPQPTVGEKSSGVSSSLGERNPSYQTAIGLQKIQEIIDVNLGLNILLREYFSIKPKVFYRSTSNGKAEQLTSSGFLLATQLQYINPTMITPILVFGAGYQWSNIIHKTKINEQLNFPYVFNYYGLRIDVTKHFHLAVARIFTRYQLPRGSTAKFEEETGSNQCLFFNFII